MVRIRFACRSAGSAPNADAGRMTGSAAVQNGIGAFVGDGLALTVGAWHPVMTTSATRSVRTGCRLVVRSCGRYRRGPRNSIGALALPLGNGPTRVQCRGSV